MSIRFAAARRRTWSPVARALARRARGRAANDNLDGAIVDTDKLLRAALEQFQVHGLGAADHAFAKAERALLSNARDEFEKWHSICRALDRPMADRLAMRQRMLDACA
ncbi:hypothetical protein PF049_10720 [Erythrobacteraceae bacterium WH01K]|nr:hypothetical protein PF049_10720 [Erythrobacteraceae bacterium WH01K]